MKLEIHGKRSREPVVRLALRENANGDIVVHVVDPDGSHHPCGNLVTISSDGVELHDGIDPELGFDLDSDGGLRLVP